MIALDTYLKSGSHLGELYAARSELIAAMTLQLMRSGNFRVRGDAITELRHQGHHALDVLILVDEAINDCWQNVIARVMSDEDLNHLATADDTALNGHPEALAPHHR